VDNIGMWARRVRTDRTFQRSKWHLIQSEIDTRIVTKCGRQMEHHPRWSTPGTYFGTAQALDIQSVPRDYYGQLIDTSSHHELLCERCR
jgi:hypothetical protein